MTIGYIVLFGGRASAATTVDEVSYSPSSPRAICGSGEPVDFAAYVDSASLNVSTGVMSYAINAGWASCDLSDSTRAYAIYANPELCPVSGTYGNQGDVTDCVKYIGNPAYSGAGNGLSCPEGSNAACIKPGTSSDIVGDQRPIATAFGYRGRVFNMTYPIDNWALARLSAGSRTVGSQMCQFYKTGSGFNTQITASRCINISITISWKYQQGNDTGSCTAIAPSGSYQPGQSVPVQYTMTNGTTDRDWSVEPGTANRYRLQNQNDDAWPNAPKVVDVAAPGQNVEFTGFGYVVRAGNTTSWTRNIDIPNNVLGNNFSGTFSFNWRIYGYNNDEKFHWVGPSCPVTINVELPITKPYFKAYNSDVVVGRGFDAGGADTCSGTSADIQADARSLAGGQWAGSGSEFAARATGIIEGFVSRDPQADGSPTALAFGNTSSSRINSFAGQPGKDAAAYSGCIPDYLQELAKDGFTELPGVNSSGVWNGNIPNGGGYFWYGEDLTINDDVILDDWTDLTDIPRFYLVVSGNINIAPNVDRIDGVIIAQPRSEGVGGIINTCAASNSEWRDCKNKLTFNGAVVADKIKLNRLNGDVSNATFREEPDSDEIAEVFNFLPELYLAQIPGQLDIPEAGPRKYDSIIGLPPVL
jgi:hypothetical protein